MSTRTTRLPQLTTLDECDFLLTEARAARDEAREDLRRRDDIPNRADMDAANVMLNYLLDCRARLKELTTPRR